MSLSAIYQLVYLTRISHVRQWLRVFPSPGAGERGRIYWVEETTYQEMSMKDPKHHRQFEEALRNLLAKLEREGVERIERSQVEEIGQRFEMDRDEAHELFMKSRGDIWQGKLIESEGEPGWEAITLENVPSTSRSPEEGTS
jgi:hypothetical protein